MSKKLPLLQILQKCNVAHPNPMADRVALDVLGAGDGAGDGGAVVQAQALPHAALHCSALYTVQYYTVINISRNL